MKNCLLVLTGILFSLILVAQKAPIDWQKRSEDPSYIHRSLKRITDVIVYDVFSPPVASRIYAYTSIAGYEASRHADTGYRSFSGQLYGLLRLPDPIDAEVYSFSLAAVQAMLQVGRTLVISDDSVAAFQRKIVNEFKSTGMPVDIFNRSIEYGNAIATHILSWAAKDNYKQTRSFPKYTVTEDDGSWRPTPPAYMKAVEPYWNRIRPFLLDSAAQFKPAAAIIFSAEKGSTFYAEASNVYTTGKQLSSQQKEIAMFWDCNPFKINLSGHVMFATKKISPGGHWINIAAQASRKSRFDFIHAAEVYACLSVAIADAFISCWDEKYRSRVIRPETYINQYIDADWMPVLQTPPFPEYSSGHSVISAAAAVILTKEFGEGYKYVDDTEMEFGLPKRAYKSFWQAAEEAAISRLYGGIHYLSAIRNGVDQGRRVGEHVVRLLKMHE